ncbi:uncharacterized protein LOC126909236, partial [Daktulosphaira vitifoliae]|uniref:uncharacterized protein LOC126909236 n=1 Tax=Daktulosphaira vitifoliae TaxID=58002 RepID=UPI0021AAD45A
MSETAFEKAVKRRNRVMRQIQSMSFYVHEFNDRTEVGHAQLKHRYEKLRELQAEFEVIQNKIEDIAEDDEQFVIRRSVDDQVFELLSVISAQMANFAETSSAKGCQSSSSKTTTNRRVKLPVIPLPTFSGRYDEWLTFRDTFRSMIHDNKDIDEIEKFHHLRAALKGEAGKVIMSLETTDDNYSIAWSSICQRYQNRRLIVGTHVAELFKLPEQKTETARGLRELVNNLNSHIRSLSSLGQPTDKWDAILIHLVTSKIHAVTLREWECTRTDDEPPTISEFGDFLDKRCLILESVEAASHIKSNAETSRDKPKEPERRRQWSKAFVVSNKEAQPAKRRQTAVLQTTTKLSSCPICKGNHWVYKCEKLATGTIDERVQQIREARLCLNCLRPGHYAAVCKNGSCKLCGKGHNTLIHRNNEVAQAEKTVANVAKAEGGSVLLSTAMVRVVNTQTGKSCMARALLDSGSMSNFMTRRLANSLQLYQEKTNLTIFGIGNSSNGALGRVHCQIQATNSTYKQRTSFVLLKDVTDRIPIARVPLASVPIPSQIQLADPKFNEPSHIDLLIGAELFFTLLRGEHVTLSDSITLQNTVFGWVIAGRVNSNENTETNIQCFTAITQPDEDLNTLLRKFWELEEHNDMTIQNSKITACDKFYRETTRRDTDGRYVVNLPLCNEILKNLGDTKTMAIRRFYALEKRLESCPETKSAYTLFMKEYEALGHMYEETQSIRRTLPEAYLPHHCVIKAESTTTKLRVVFDASAKSTTGISLNQSMMVGPTIQEDLFNILIRFRLHCYVITGDIEKMYRQVKICEPHQQLQKIIWRDRPTETLKTYVLTTVTYGTAAAPYLAVRTLHQLAEDEGDSLPVAAQAIKRDFYVDDLLTGADTLTEARRLQRDVSSLCEKGGFLLRKWCANHTSLLSHLPENLKGTIHKLNFSDNMVTKALGVNWVPVTDSLHYKVTEWKPAKTVTRRVVTSEIAKLFDPLGLMGPIIVTAKIFIQSLWRLNTGWDSPLPLEYTKQWIKYRKGLVILNNITIPRRSTISTKQGIQIHVFCDASELAYGTCVYIRSTNDDSIVYCQLLCSKSRVAPLRNTTIPRLELCATLLGARLLDKVKTALKGVVKINRCCLWSDSTVALTWITDQQGSRSWKTFIANRVGEIHDRTAGCEWLYVKGEDNPADVISRGISASQLAENQRWFCGPEWLTYPEDAWPNNTKPQVEEPIPERRIQQVSLISTEVTDDTILKRFSRVERLQRVTAYMLRFIKNCKREKTTRFIGELSVSEVQDGLNVWVRKSQHTAFSTNIDNLKNAREMNKN